MTEVGCSKALDVYVSHQPAGMLFEAAMEEGVFFYLYYRDCLPMNAVSLTMPVVADPYQFDYKHQLHPIFDMNLPEGDLRKRLRQKFSKAIPNFNDLDLLEIVGNSQIGRLRFAIRGMRPADVPAQSVRNLIAHDGAEGLLDSLMERYAVHSGISGVQPKVLVRDSDNADIERLTHRDATHIVKAWHSEYPQLAANEYFCLRAAILSKLTVPNFELSSHGKFLIIERFDLDNGNYLGFEDFCVLNGKTSDQKYDGSYEGITKRIREFVSPDLVRPALESYFKTLVLSCVVKNGDAHLKNFGVLYENSEKAVHLSPVYDIVSTTPYNPKDSLALTLGGSKRWPKATELIKFAIKHCNLTTSRAEELMGEVVIGVATAFNEMSAFMEANEYFREIGTAMQSEWSKGLSLSVDAGNVSTVSNESAIKQCVNSALNRLTANQKAVLIATATENMAQNEKDDRSR